MKTFTANDLTPAIIEHYRKIAHDHMQALGCYIAPNTITPTAVCVTWEEAIRDARINGNTQPEEVLRKYYDELRAAYHITENVIYVKDDVRITESLLVHELVHSYQNGAEILKIVHGKVDPSHNFEEYFEMEAYMIQGIWEADLLDKVLNDAARFNSTPYQHLEAIWPTAKQNLINHMQGI